MPKDIYSENYTIYIRPGALSGETVTIDSLNFVLTGTMEVSDVDSPDGTALTIAGTNANVNIEAPIDKRITLGSDDDQVTLEIIHSGPRFVFTAEKDTNNGVVQINNDSNDTAADGLDITINRANPAVTNGFIKFHDGNGDTRGRIRGSDSGTDEAFQSDGSEPAVNQVGSKGDVVFASGTSDFGEWVSVGDVFEWGLGDEEISQLSDKFSFGLPEGYVVYVRGESFYKEPPGTPMVVTHRAIVVGNERDSNDIGEILSFIGQVPVIVKGKANSGDFLIPTGSYFCEAKDPSTITFQEYLSVIGTAWEDKTEDELKKILCAIGVKSILK